MAGKPGRSGAEAPTVKQQREARRAEKVAAFQREQARRARNRRIGLWAGIGGGLVAVAAIVAVVIVSSTPKTIEGLMTFSNEATHVDGTVDYPQDPPAGGPHAPIWLNCGIYDQAVPDENAVHALEHGAVWVTYDPALSEAEVQTLRDAVPSTYAVLSPYPGLPAPVVVSAWDAQLRLDGVDDPRLASFIQAYWKSPNAPEPGALCTGGLDALGRVA